MTLQSPSSKSVLIADDDPSTRELFEMLLLRQGFRVNAVASGALALEAMKSKKFGKVDLILMDLMMPGPGGYDVVQQLAGAGFEDVPVLVVSARIMDAQTIDTIRSEPNVRGILQKPVEPLTLTSKVHEVLGTEPKKAFNEWVD